MIIIMMIVMIVMIIMIVMIASNCSKIMMIVTIVMIMIMIIVTLPSNRPQTTQNGRNPSATYAFTEKKHGHPLRCPLDWCTIATCIERHYYDFDGFVVSWQQKFHQKNGLNLQKYVFSNSRVLSLKDFFMVSFMRGLDYPGIDICDVNHL